MTGRCRRHSVRVSAVSCSSAPRRLVALASCGHTWVATGTRRLSLPPGRPTRTRRTPQRASSHESFWENDPPTSAREERDREHYERMLARGWPRPSQSATGGVANRVDASWRTNGLAGPSPEARGSEATRQGRSSEACAEGGGGGGAFPPRTAEPRVARWSPVVKEAMPVRWSTLPWISTTSVAAAETASRSTPSAHGRGPPAAARPAPCTAT